jgi:hypothetical protein
MARSDDPVVAAMQATGMRWRDLVPVRVRPPAYTRLDIPYTVATDEAGVEWVGPAAESDDWPHVEWKRGGLDHVVGFHETVTPKDLARFVHAYGPLRLCGHRAARALALFEIPYRRPEDCPRCRGGWDGRTPVSVWRAVAAAMRAALLIGAKLRTREDTRAEWWTALAWGNPAAEAHHVERQAWESQWWALYKAVRSWYCATHVHDFGWDLEPTEAEAQAGERAEVIVPLAGPYVAARDLLGLLVWELQTCLFTVQGVYICENPTCGLLHGRKHKPHKNRRVPALCHQCEQKRKAQRNHAYYVAHAAAKLLQNGVDTGRRR